MEASSTRADGIPSPSAVSFVSGFEMPFGTGVRQMFEGIPKKKEGRQGQTDRQTRQDQRICTREMEMFGIVLKCAKRLGGRNG